MSYHNTAPYKDWWDQSTKEDIHRCSVEAEYFAPLKMCIATDTYGNKEVYRYTGYSMVEQTELESYRRTCPTGRATVRNSDIEGNKNIHNYMANPKPHELDEDEE